MTSQILFPAEPKSVVPQNRGGLGDPRPPIPHVPWSDCHWGPAAGGAATAPLQDADQRIGQPAESGPSKTLRPSVGRIRFSRNLDFRFCGNQGVTFSILSPIGTLQVLNRPLVQKHFPAETVFADPTRTPRPLFVQTNLEHRPRFCSDGHRAPRPCFVQTNLEHRDYVLFRQTSQNRKNIQTAEQESCPGLVGVQRDAKFSVQR